MIVIDAFTSLEPSVFPALANTLSSAMAYDLKGTPVPHHLLNGSLKPTLEERKGLLSDAEDRDGEPPRYEDEEYTKPQGRIPLQKMRVAQIAGSFIGLILSVAFLAPISGMWRCGMGAARQPTDPSKLLSNGTHEFKRTVLAVSFDGLR